jgi:hypothetical protein
VIVDYVYYLIDTAKQAQSEVDKTTTMRRAVDRWI